MVSNESRIRFHAAFELVLDQLVAEVAKEKERDPENYRKSPKTRLLAAIYRAISEDIPSDPEDPRFHQMDGEGGGFSQWRRAKPAQGYRLFFKYLNEENLIVYAWVNSEISLAKYRSHLEAYRDFQGRR